MIKVSKFCNLRCRYCYEFPFLGDRARMSLDDLERLFRNCARSFEGTGRRLDFVWHGGEPVLLGTDYFRRAFDVQRAALEPAGHAFTNSIQTNLTVLNDDVVDLLRTCFDEVGVSVDLFGGNRVTARGVDAQPKVLAGMQRLIDERIPFGCITVLSRSTLDHVDEIQAFYESLDLGFRLLPFYRTGYDGQSAVHGLSDAEIVGALRRVTDRWFASGSRGNVEPVTTYVQQVLDHLSLPPGARRRYDKAVSEAVFIIDTDGSVYSNGDAYDPVLSHGSLFTDDLPSMRGGPGYRRALAESRERMAATCACCEFFGGCSGYPMAEATPEQRWRDPDGSLRCGVAAPMHRHILRTLRSIGLVTPDGRLDRGLLQSRAGRSRPPAGVGGRG